MDALNIIILGKSRYNGKWLRGVALEIAIKTLPDHDNNQITNAWKIANGLTKPNRLKSKK